MSGGNIQKVLLARELTANATLVVFTSPLWARSSQTKLARERILEGARGSGDDRYLNRARRADRDQRPHRCHVPREAERVVPNDDDADRQIGILMDGGGSLTGQLDLARTAGMSKPAAIASLRGSRRRRRILLPILLALAASGIVLLLLGKDPLAYYFYGWSAAFSLGRLAGDDHPMAPLLLSPRIDRRVRRHLEPRHRWPISARPPWSRRRWQPALVASCRAASPSSFAC